MSALCSANCGWCGACTAAWEREPEDDVEPEELSEEEQRAREQRDETFTRGVQSFFEKSAKAV